MGIGIGCRKEGQEGIGMALKRELSCLLVMVTYQFVQLEQRHDKKARQVCFYEMDRTQSFIERRMSNKRSLVVDVEPERSR
jgi:hypothetical protein